MSYTDVFGNDTLPPSEYGYHGLVLTSDLTVVWPYNTDSTSSTVAKINNISCDSGNSLTLPDATLVSTGEDFLIRNVGSNTLTVRDSGGATIATVLSGAASYFYLTDNTTSAGLFGVIAFGVGTSTVDAASLVGYGITAVGASLNQSHPVFPSSSSMTLDATHRSKLVVFTGGVSTLSLTTASTLGDNYFAMVRNDGTGTVTIDPAASETIDGMTTMQLQPAESLMLVCTGVKWYSVGYGRSTLYQFTQLTKDVSAAGTITLTAAEAANKLITFIGNPASAVTVVVPAIVAVYYTYSSISTSQTVTLKTSAGSGVGITQGSRIIALCDGTNVLSAQSAVANASLSLTDGSAAIPALFFATQTNTGLYKSGTQDVGITVNGSTVGVFGDTGLQSSTLGANSTQRHTVPAVASDTLTLNAATQTLTNKTLAGSAFNGTVGATTPSTGAFTTLSASGKVSNTSGGAEFAAASSSAVLKLSRTTTSAGSGWIGADSSCAFRTYNGALSVSALQVNQDAVDATAVVSSTGLAVTGALSATDTSTISKSQNGATRIIVDNQNTGASAVAGVALQASGGTWTVDVPYSASFVNPLQFIFGGSEKMRLDPSGNLGLGVVPSAWNSSYGVFQGNGGHSLSCDGISSNSFDLASNAYRSAAGVWTKIENATATKYRQIAGSHIWQTAESGSGTASFTDSMTLDASGNLLVGATTSTVYPANGVQMFTGTQGIVAVGHTSTASGAVYTTFSYNGSGIGTITQSGTTAVAYNTTSDHRLKENVRPANAARFMDIEFVDFEWVDGRHDCGVIAHQLQSVYPDLVLGEKDATETRQVELTPAIPAVLDEEGSEVTPAVEATYEDQVFPKYQQVNYIGLIGRMGTTIQKQQRMLEAMEARLAALEAA